MGIAKSIAKGVRNFFRQEQERNVGGVGRTHGGPTAPGGLLAAYGEPTLSEYLRLDHDLLTRFAEYEEMDEYPMLAVALDIYADDATQTDMQTGRSVWVTARDRDVETVLDDLLHRRLRIDDEVWGIARELCLAEGTRIWAEGRLMPVEDVPVGAFIEGYTPEGPIRTRVTARACTGIKPVFTVRTKHREITLTANHPVLTRNKSGQDEWVKVEDLVHGRYPSGGLLANSSRVVICTEMLPGAVPEWEEIAPGFAETPAWGEKGNPNPLILPERITPEFCRLFGFLLGDGFRIHSSTTHTIAYARGVYPELNDLYDGMFASLGLLPRVICRENREWATLVHSVRLERLLLALGWTDGAHNKRVPGWVFGLPVAHREAFLQGFLDADGWETECKTRREGAKTAYHVELCNEALVRDIKNLVDGLGYSSGRVRSRFRKNKGSINGVEIRPGWTYALTFSRTRFPTPFIAERVISVEPAGETRVYDLTVEDEGHNFVAEGVVVHNCKYGQDYEELLVDNDGVQALHFLPAPTMRRVEGPRGEFHGFIQDFSGAPSWTPEQFKEALRLRHAKDDAPVTALEDWEVVHFRLRGRHRRSSYGHSVLEPARWVFRRLQLLEDAALLYRLQRAPERHAFYVDIGDLPPREGLAYLNQIRMQHRKKRFIDPTTGKLNLRWEPLVQDEDFYIPVRDGVESTRVETLQSPSWQCVVGDTRIPLLDGTEPTIQELAERGGEFWVYSIDENGRIVPGRGRSARLTHEAAEIWEVGLDNGEVVRCTGNHPFLTRDGRWVRADALEPGQALMPLYRKASTKQEGDRIEGYEKVYDPASGEWLYTHHRVFQEATGSDLSEFFRAGNVIHHENCLKDDNRPENLRGMSRSSQITLHIQSAPQSPKYLNRSVSFVRKTEDVEPVYDITVDTHHCFAISQGVIIHNSMDDVEYFRDLLFASIKVPKAYLGQEEGVARAVLSSEDVRFARSVLRVQRELRAGFRKVCRVHLAALGVDPYSVDFDIRMTTPSSIFELAQLEVRSARADLAQRLQGFVSMKWVLEKVFGFSDDEIEMVFAQKGEDLEREAVQQARAMAKSQEASAPAGGMGMPMGDPADPGGGGGVPEEEPWAAGGSEEPAADEAMRRLRKGFLLAEQARARLPVQRSSGIPERELFAGDRAAERRSEAKLDKLLRQDRVMAARLNELGRLLHDLKATRR